MKLQTVRNLSIVAFFLLVAIAEMVAQTDQNGLQQRRTYPIDSCIYIMVPTQFSVRDVFEFRPPATGLQMTFQSNATSSAILDDIFGRGQTVVNGEDFLIWQNWQPLQRGEMILALPENALLAGSEDPNVPHYPIIINGFLTKIEEVQVSPPYPVMFQLVDLEVTE
jgi:hypothetical protein